MAAFLQMEMSLLHCETIYITLVKCFAFQEGFVIEMIAKFH